MSEMNHDQSLVSRCDFKMHNVLFSGFGLLRLLGCPKKATVTLDQVYLTFQPLGSVRSVPEQNLDCFSKNEILVEDENQ